MSSHNRDEMDFTNRAWEALYSAVDDPYFRDKDANLIYKTLQDQLTPIYFGDYLKRYIYTKADLTGDYDQIPIKEYQEIIQDSFKENHTPASFSDTTTKLSALAKNWLTQKSVKRKVVFLLGFGLRMSVDDVNEFLTKALREPAINPKDPFEVACWYCYKHGYNYLKFKKIKDEYLIAPPNPLDPWLAFDEHTAGYRTKMRALDNEESLIAHLSSLKNSDNISKISVTAREQYGLLYEEARKIIAELYNYSSEEQHMSALDNYKDKLARSDKLPDYEKIRRINNFRGSQNIFSYEDISAGDIERVLCSAIPTDRHGNLTPAKASALNEQFEGKRFSRQRINDILSDAVTVDRFDLITLNFFVHSQKSNSFRTNKQRYTEFLESTNGILELCSMGKLYIQNPYECFVLMCILSDEPLSTYADVWELSYTK